MKIKRYVLLFTFSVLFSIPFVSCNNNTIEPKIIEKPSNKETKDVIDIINKEKLKESIENNYVAIIPTPPPKINILSKIQPKMEYPYDIEVTKDGKTIYFKNWYNYPKENDNYLDEQIPEQYEKLVKRKVIYKLDVETKKIEIFKIGDDPLVYNEMGSEMEIDDEGNLYVNILNEYVNKYSSQINKSMIYKISPEGEILYKYSVFEDDKSMYRIGSTYNPSEFYKFQGPINLIFNKNFLFYVMYLNDTEIYSNRFYLIKKLDLMEKKIIEFSKKNYSDFQYNIIIFDIFEIISSKNILNKDVLFIENDRKKLNFNPIDKIRTNYNITNKNIKINSKNDFFRVDFDLIYKYNLNSKEINIIGNYPYGYKDGMNMESRFDYPSSLSIDGKDNIYVADTGNNAIRKITPQGEVSTLYKE